MRSRRPRATSARSPLGEAEHEQRGVRDVEDGVGRPESGWAAPRAPSRCAPRRPAPPAGTRGRAAARSAPRGRPRTARSRRAARRPRCPGGLRACVASASRSAPSSKIESAATRPGDDRRGARAEPAGERDVGADRELEVVRRRAARRTRARSGCAGRGRSAGRCGRRTCPVSTTSTSMCRSSAAPMTSNPGPRLAEDAGTRTVRRLFTRGRPSRPPPCPARTARPRPPGRARSAGP